MKKMNKHKKAFFILIFLFLILSVYGVREIMKKETFVKEYSLLLGNMDIKTDNIIVQKKVDIGKITHETEYTINDPKKIESLFELLNNCQLEEIKPCDALKLDPKEYYYIKFNLTESMQIIAGKELGKYYGKFVKVGEKKAIIINFNSYTDVAKKIADFLEKNQLLY
jgi:hypothetical protein